MLYDSHTHLNSDNLFPQRQTYVDLFMQAGGKGLINSGANESYNLRGIEIAKASSIAKCTLGQHPLECVENHIFLEDYKQKMQELKQLYQANQEHVVAVGETGIDVHFPNGPETLKLQKELFALHCDRAQEIGLPLVVHSRDDFQTSFDILKNYKNQTIHFHCRSYDTAEYRQLVDYFPNLLVGFCGNVTYKKAQNLRDTLAIADLERILIETDAPWLSPQVVRGETNHPANIKYIYEFIAQEKNIPLQALETQSEKNFKKVYKL